MQFGSVGWSRWTMWVAGEGGKVVPEVKGEKVGRA